MPFQIVRNDITKVKADAIVNTANPNVKVGYGVDSAIYNAAGYEKLLEARKKIGRLEPGQVAVTEAFDLDAKFIIHVSGPWWAEGKNNEIEVLRICYDEALRIAFENGCESIAFPLLATGSYGFPKKLGIQIAVDAFTSFLEEHEMEILLVVFGSECVSISGELVGEVSSFIDDGYVETAFAEEYKYLEPDGSRCERTPKLRNKSSKVMRCESASLSETAACDEIVDLKEITIGAAIKASHQSLEDALKEIYTDSFEKHLQKLINKKGLKNSEIYVAANISKQYFSKLLKGQVKPSKEKMLALAVGLRLNIDETVDFLRVGGYALSPISQTDVIVEYFIEHEDYNVMKIDIVLFDYGLDPLS